MLNRITVVGRITRDLKLRTTESGKEMVLFTIANEDNYKNKKKVNYFSAVLWGREAKKLVTNAKKGSTVLLIGKLLIENTKLENGQYTSKSQLFGSEFMLIKPAVLDRPMEGLKNNVDQLISDPQINFDEGE